MEYLRWRQLTPEEALDWLYEHNEHGKQHGTIDVMQTVRLLFGLGIGEMKQMIYDHNKKNDS